MISITRYRVWPDGDVQEADTPAHHWKSDDYELVEAPTPEDAWARAKANAPAVPQGGLVVWRYELATSVDSEGAGTGWRWHLTEGMPNVPEGMIRNLQPYTPAPGPAPSKGAVGFGARALAAELAEAALKDDNDPEGHDISAGLFGPNVSAWLRKVASEYLAAPAPAVPAEIDVRTILLDIVPGDGNGQEVYARTVDDVVNKLTEMAERLDAAEAPAPAQEMTLTYELIKEAAGQPEGYKFAAKGITKIDVWPHGGNWFPLYSLAQVQAIIAARRAKGGKL